MGNWDVSKPNKDGEPSDDAISRRAVMNLAVKIELPDSQTFFCISPEDVEALPSVTPKQRTGHWKSTIDEKSHHWVFRCDKCGWIQETTTNYCPDCGKRMVEPQESDHKCHTCKHYTSGEDDGSCGSYICKGYSNWESEE